jgi:hypothetical protein
MKRILLSGMAACFLSAAMAQTDTTGKKDNDSQVDTINVGGMIIIKKKGESDHEYHYNESPKSYHHWRKKPENLSTNWFVFDIGFSNFNDQTNYKSSEAQAFAPGSTDDWFDINSGKSRNVNIWFFMQTLNVSKHVLNLKYGLGLDLNNYFFEDERIRFNKNPTYVYLDSTLKNAKKNKLAADYITVPLMLNFNFTPDRRQGFGLSFGVSAGYLYNSRQKVKLDGDKFKVHDSFDLEYWKFSYIAELLFGPVKLYGSYAMHNMWQKGLDQTPYTFGFRFSY